MCDLLYSTVVLALVAGYGDGSNEAGITAVVMFSVIVGLLNFGTYMELQKIPTQRPR